MLKAEIFLTNILNWGSYKNLNFRPSSNGISHGLSYVILVASVQLWANWALFYGLSQALRS